jgi:hypothetical protein
MSDRFDGTRKSWLAYTGPEKSNARADSVDVLPKIGEEASRYRLRKMVADLKRDHARIYGTAV